LAREQAFASTAAPTWYPDRTAGFAGSKSTPLDDLIVRGFDCYQPALELALEEMFAAAI
jgi:hypothetical protein